MIDLTKNLFEIGQRYYQAPNAVAAPSTVPQNGVGNRELMRRTFNALPNRGINLNIAGKGQNPMLANKVDQKTFDSKFQQVAAGNRNLNPAGVPVKAPPVPVVPVQAAKPVINISGPEAAKIALQKGVETTKGVLQKGFEATKDVATAGGQAVAKFAGDHPTATGAALGATGAIAVGAGLRKILRRKDKEE